MSFAFDFYYRSPEDMNREEQVIAEVASGGGRLDFREPADRVGGPICLTFDFESRTQAETIAAALQTRGEHVEGVYDY
ncbi:MAG: hypothetical protein QM796_11185 [Chthoniobacteraceae bacterium]